MDIRSISQKILKIRKNLSRKSTINERWDDSSYYETCIPLTLQDLVRNYTPTHVNQLKRSQLLLMRNIKNQAKHYLNIWKSVTKTLQRLNRKTQSCKFNLLKLNPVLSHTNNKSLQLTSKTHFESNRKKTIQKLESSIKLLRSIRKVQKQNLINSFKSLKFNSNLLKISKLFERLLIKTYKNVIFSIRTYSKHELSIISENTLSITPTSRVNFPDIREKSSSFLNRHLDSPCLVSKRYSNHESEDLEFDSDLRDSIRFDLPNMSSYESLNITNMRHPQIDSLGISNSFIVKGTVDESLVELEGDHFNDEVSPSCVNRSGEVIGISGKSASTAIVPRRFTYVDRYNNLASRDTITEVSASKCSLSDIIFEAKIDDTKNSKDIIKFSGKWKGANPTVTSSIFKSKQGHNFGKIVKKRRQNSSAKLN